MRRAKTRLMLRTKNLLCLGGNNHLRMAGSGLGELFQSGEQSRSDFFETLLLFDLLSIRLRRDIEHVDNLIEISSDFGSPNRNAQFKQSPGNRIQQPTTIDREDVEDGMRGRCCIVKTNSRRRGNQVGGCIGWCTAPDAAEARAFVRIDRTNQRPANRFNALRRRRTDEIRIANDKPV